MRVINTVLLSYGMSGKLFHAPFLRTHPGFKLLGAWERNSRMIESDCPGTRSYHSLEEAIADPQVELVVVNTPTSTHVAYATSSLEAGKHVVVEKAFTVTTQEAVELDRLAKACKLKLAVYQNRRWDSDFKTVQELLRQGTLGQVNEVLISYERFNLALSPKKHREEPGPGAGNLMDLGPHCIDPAIHFFGMPDEVFADIRICRPGSRVDDYFEILLYYPAMRVRLRSSYLVREPGPAFVLHGSNGSFVKYRGDVQEAQLKAGMKPDKPVFGIEAAATAGLLHIDIKGKVTRQTIPSEHGNYREFYDAIHRALTEDVDVPVKGAEGINVLRIIEAAVESSRRRTSVKIQ